VSSRLTFFDIEEYLNPPVTTNLEMVV